MSDLATKFAEQQSAIWETGHGFHNASTRARLLGAKRIGPYDTPEYRQVPKDIPTSLWEFGDGSKLVIFDDGSGLHREDLKA